MNVGERRVYVEPDARKRNQQPEPEAYGTKTLSPLAASQVGGTKQISLPDGPGVMLLVDCCSPLLAANTTLSGRSIHILRTRTVVV